MQDSVIERVRCAIWNSVFDGRISERDAAAVARAVLQALREPTRTMLAAVDDEDSDPMVARGRAYSAWQAMIDTAINEGDA